MESPLSQLAVRSEVDVLIVGAGPVGLAIAIELAKLELTIRVVDRRPPLDVDPGVRPQLLVAREADLANLAHLGIELDDPRIVSPIASRCSGELLTGAVTCVETSLPEDPVRSADLWALSGQTPAALVPIGRLQRTLLAIAQELGVEVLYGCDVRKLRRHARSVSLVCNDGTSLQAAAAIVATGAARALVTGEVREGPVQRLIGGVFAATAEQAGWTRVELPVPGLGHAARCTLLQTSSASGAGTALLVDARCGALVTDRTLHRCFDEAARRHGLAGTPMLSRPLVFATAVTAAKQRVLAGDGRAPVVVAGDAAQTGHVFTGQTCFVNVALGLELARQLGRARAALVERKVGAPALADALQRYDTASAEGAAVLARASEPHAPPSPPSADSLFYEAARRVSASARPIRRTASASSLSV